jgi:ParB-like chromosome segregation protein Spo0J
MSVKHSFNSLMKSGKIKRADTGMKIRYADLVLGWNAREHDQRWEESIIALTAFLRTGGQVPPLQVQVLSNGDVEIAEGYRRHESYGRLIAEGMPIEWIDIEPFKGNNADRFAHIVNSNNQLQLTPLEKGKVYKELDGLKLDRNEIARLVHASRPQVDNYLLLAYANTDVHNLVKSCHVSADTAIDFIRKFGEEAGKHLEAELQKARGQGKAKVTSGTVKGKSLPSKISGAAIAELETFASSLPQAVHTQLYKLKKARAEQGLDDDEETGMVEVPAKYLSKILDAHGDIEAARAKQEEKQRLREAKAAQGELGVGGSHG